MSYVIQRFGRLALVIVAVTFLSTTFLSLLPGDAAAVKCGGTCTTEQYNEVRAQMGLDKPILARYVAWLGKVLPPDIDLGRSDLNSEQVTTALGQRLPVTLELLILAQLFALAIAIPVGVIAARRPNGVFDRVSTTGGFVFLAVPTFVYGAAVHQHLRRQPALGAGHGLHGAHREPRREPAQPAAAGAHPGPGRGRGVLAAAAHRPHGHAAGGLHHDGQGEGPDLQAHPVAPRLPALAVLTDHRDRPAHGLPHRRGADHREPTSSSTASAGTPSRRSPTGTSSRSREPSS